MKFFKKRENLPVPSVEILRREMSERDVNFIVRLLAEFCLFLLTRAKKAERPTENVSFILPKRTVIDPGIIFKKEEKVKW